ncbi:MAG: flagellar biosynthesis anti-sigma factor FlgM [Clostridiales bacterium]|nr:flagellar biosynthesis anti-sigma factor FlgM [Clostridiales bacterium]
MCEKDYFDDIDCINVSEVERAKEIVARAPDVREDKIKEVKEKYSDPNYAPDEAIIADRIIEDLEIIGEIKNGNSKKKL